MLDKINYNSWASRMLLYIKGKDHGKLLADSVLNGSFQYGTMVEPRNKTTPATIRARTYADLINEEKIRESVDIKATNVVLQGLPQDIYNLVNHNEDAKQIWDKVKLLIQGSELSLPERESKLHDDFDTFTSMPGETIHLYYMRFAQLINDMHTIRMTMKPLQVNTKFVNHLQLEWRKFVTNVKLAKDMHTTKFDHLYAHLWQHKAHANEVCLARQRVLIDNGDTVIPAQASKEIPTPATFQTDDLDAFDSDCDDVPTTKAILIANLSFYNSDFFLK
ncbi:hypothetical protein Tco_1523202, partial [Tanacetum coccineum]